MALTIKNPETVRLAKALAHQAGMTQTGAITYSLRRCLAELDSPESARRARVERILESVWRGSSAREAARVATNLDGLYNDQGLPA
jgi:hypothetical protein